MHLEFDEATHIYKVGGVVTPSITQILKAVGIVDARFYNEAARERGTWVHNFTRLYDEGNVDWSKIPDDYRRFCEAYAQFCLDEEFQPVHIETRMAGPGRAGTLDRRALLPKRAPGVSQCEFKTGQNWPGHEGPQSAGYDDLFQLMIKEGYFPATSFNGRRFGLLLKPDGSYKVKEMNEWDDFQTIRAAIHTYHRQKVRL